MTLKTGTGKRTSLAKDSDQPQEIKRAIRKADEYAKLAADSTNQESRDYFLRMQRKWLGIAEGWMVIANINKPPR